jgi:hypothetical protein
MRMHWRTGDGHVASCGRWIETAFFVVANVEAVTCGNCLRSNPVNEKQREERRAARR